MNAILHDQHDHSVNANVGGVVGCGLGRSLTKCLTPEAFAAVDRNLDAVISHRELAAWVAVATPDQICISQRQRSKLGDRRPDGPGGEVGTRIGVGGRGNAFFCQQQAYIQDYHVVNGQYDPLIGASSTGIALDVSNITITILQARQRCRECGEWASSC